MAQISTERIRTLRERTGAGMMDVKRALEQAGGNEEEAIRILREKGLAQAARRATRKALEGVVEAHVDADRGLGGLVEINCETDFVAKTGEFRNLARALARLAAESAEQAGAGAAVHRDPRGETSPARVEELLKKPLLGFEGRSASEALADTAARVGERVRLRRYVAFRGAEGGAVLEAYVHGEGRIGVLIEVVVEPAQGAGKPEVRALIRDLAMQVAAFRAEYVERPQVPQAVLEREKEIYRAAALGEGKRAAVVDRIVAGRLEKFYQEVCLLEQPFMRDPGVSVGGHLQQQAQAAGVRLQVRRFARFERAEQLAGEADAGQE